MSRVFHALIALVAMLLFGLCFATAGWVLANFTPDTDVVPTWCWNLNFTVMMLAGLIGGGYSVFKLLDEIFMTPCDRRRITGRRKAPAKSLARSPKVTWASDRKR